MGGRGGVDSLGIQVFKEMVHFKSKDNLSPAKVKALCAAGCSYIRSAPNVKWMASTAVCAVAMLLTLSI